MTNDLAGLISREALKKKFSLSDRMLRGWQKMGLRPVRMGRRLYYWQDEVAQWVSINCRVNETKCGVFRQKNVRVRARARIAQSS